MLDNFERYWRPALEATKISEFRFHDCRHTFASQLAMAGVDLYTRMGRTRKHLRRLARPEGIEPPTLGLEGRCSIQLSYGRVLGLSLFGGRAATSECLCVP